ncbi:hypothetical protein INR49_026889 [Caranx melampygus]|nr:hypothetical protein INR49_026889 [Caranx melampygus]
MSHRRSLSRSPPSVASENTRTFKSVMKLVPLMTAGGHRGTAGLPVKLHLLPSVENRPHRLYFKTAALLSRQRHQQQGEASPIKHQKRRLQ